MTAEIGRVVTGGIEVKVNIPPRRRSATLSVPLDEHREASAVVNVKSVRLTVKTLGRYGASQAVTLPRDRTALVALAHLIDAVNAEIEEQERWAERDEAERKVVTE